MIVGDKTFAAKNVTVKVFNNTGASQLLTNVQITWPQGTNGNLTKITLNGATIFNTSTGGGSLNTSSFVGTAAQRTIASGSCGTFAFGFQSNVSTNPANYTGQLTFSPFGPVTILP